MKQTAVEWFEAQVGHNSLMGLKEFNEIFEQAKEMEKEQIEEAYMVGYYNHSVNSIMDSEEYYEQNFKL
jgi:hypothetical protein